MGVILDDDKELLSWAKGLDTKLVPKPKPSTGWWTPERVNQAVTHLQQNAGLSPIGAHGLVSRWAGVEAQGGPDSVNPTSGAFGVGQWLGSRKKGVPSDFEGQLNHAVKELNTTESAAAKRLRLARTSEDAAIGASMFERAEGYDPKTGRDKFVDSTIQTMNRLGTGYHPASNPDAIWSNVDDLLARTAPQMDESAVWNKVDELLGDQKPGSAPTPTVTPGANIPIAPESQATQVAQTASAANPDTPRGLVLLNPGQTPNVRDPQWEGFQAFKYSAPNAPERFAMVNLKVAKKLGLKDPEHIQNFLKLNPKALEAFGIHAETVQDTSQGAAVHTSHIDPVSGQQVEDNSSIVTTPQTKDAQIALDQANHPGSVSQVVDAQDVVQKRQIQSGGQAGQKPFVNTKVGSPALDKQEHTDSRFLDEGTVETPLETRPTQAVKPSEANNAVADTFHIKADSPEEADRQLNEQLEAKYGKLQQPAHIQNLVTGEKWKGGEGDIDITFGNLQAYGVDTTPLLQQKVAEAHTETPVPDLRVGKDFTKDDADALREKFGDTTGTGIAALLHIGGKTAQQIGGLIRLIEMVNPVTGAESSVLGEQAPSYADDAYKFLKQVGDTTGKLVQNSGEKELTYDKDGHPVMSDTLASQVEKKAIEIGGDLARLYTMAGALPGATSVLGRAGQGATVFGTQNVVETAGQGADAAEIARQTAKGVAVGALFGVAPTVGEAITDTAGTLLNKSIPKLFTEGATLGTIGGGTYAIAKIAGDSNSMAAQEAIVNSLFHVVPQVLGKTVEFVGTKIKARVSKDGEVTIAPDDAKADVQIEPKNEAAEKVIEPVVDAVADDVRKKVAPIRLKSTRTRTVEPEPAKPAESKPSVSETPKSETQTEKDNQSGDNSDGGRWEGSTTQKGDVTVTEFSGIRADGKRSTVGGREMSAEELIAEFPGIHESDLELLQRYPDITVREQRESADGRGGLTVLARNVEGHTESLEIAYDKSAGERASKSPLTTEIQPKPDSGKIESSDIQIGDKVTNGLHDGTVKEIIADKKYGDYAVVDTANGEKQMSLDSLKKDSGQVLEQPRESAKAVSADVVPPQVTEEPKKVSKSTKTTFGGVETATQYATSKIHQEPFEQIRRDLVRAFKLKPAEVNKVLEKVYSSEERINDAKAMILLGRTYRGQFKFKDAQAIADKTFLSPAKIKSLDKELRGMGSGRSFGQEFNEEGQKIVADYERRVDEREGRVPDYGYGQEDELSNAEKHQLEQAYKALDARRGGAKPFDAETRAAQIDSSAVKVAPENIISTAEELVRQHNEERIAVPEKFTSPEVVEKAIASKLPERRPFEIYKVKESGGIADTDRYEVRPIGKKGWGIFAVEPHKDMSPTAAQARAVYGTRTRFAKIPERRFKNDTEIANYLRDYYEQKPSTQSPDRISEAPAQDTGAKSGEGNKVAEPKTTETDPFAKNKIVTADRVADIRAQIEVKTKGVMSAGINPELLKLYVELGAAHVEAGARTFAEFTKRMASEGIKLADDELRKIYARIRGMHGFEGMEDVGDKGEIPPKKGIHIDLKEPERAPQTPEEIQITSIKKAIDEAERKLLNLPDAPPVERKTFEDARENAAGIIQKDPLAGQKLVTEMNTTPRALNPDEKLVLLHYKRRLDNELNDAVRAVNDGYASNNEAQVAENQARLATISDERLAMMDAGRKQGAAAGQSLVFQKALMKEDYSLASLESRKRAANGGRPLTDAERAELQNLADEYQRKNEELERHLGQKELELMGLKEKMPNPRIIQVAENVVKKLDQRADMARERLKKRGTVFTAGLDPLALKDLAEIGASHIAKLGLDFAKWSNAMVKEFGEKIKPHLEKIYGASNKLVEGIEPGARERVLGAKTPEELATRIKDRIKDGNDDVSNLIQRLAKMYVGEGVKDREDLIDKVHNAVKDVIPERRDVMDAISGYGKFKQLSKDAVDATLRDLKGQMQQIAKLEDMAQGTAPSKTGIERRSPSDTERELIKQVEEAKRQGGYKITDPATQLKTALQAAKTRLQNQITDLQKQIDRQERIIKKRSSVQHDEAYNTLKTQRDELKKQFDDIFGSEMSDEQRLRNWKNRIGKRIKELNEKLLTGDYSKRAQRPPIGLDPEGFAMKADVERLKKDFERELRRDQLKNRPTYQKVLDGWAKYVRAGFLSWPTTLGKLTNAAMFRMATNTIEEPLKKGLAKITGMNTPVTSVAAEAKAWKGAVTTGMKDAWKMLKNQDSDLDVLLGTEKYDHALIDYFGQLHGALKAPVKRAGFERNLQMQIEQGMKNGEDVSNPLIQAKYTVEAYKAANRDIFMQDNVVATAYRRMLNALEAPNKEGKASGGGKVVATAAKTIFPIVKIPLNFVAETTTYTPVGLISGAARLGRAFTKGMNTVSAEEQQVILRHLVKGSLGTGMLLLGFFSPDNVGGYYQQYEKRKPNEPQAGGLRFFGYNLPRWLGHVPILEAAQIGATLRRVYDQSMKKDPQGSKTLALSSGGLAASLGLIEETPFVNEIKDFEKLLSDRERADFIGEFSKSRLIPGFIQWSANQSDKTGGKIPPDNAKDVFNYFMSNTQKRKPAGKGLSKFGQHLETGVPYLRQQVPKKTTDDGLP